MTEEVSRLAPQILETVKQSQKILLTFHTYPDPDSVGGCLALMLLLQSMGKQVTLIAGDQSKQSSMQNLPGYNQVQEKNIFDLNLADFDLLIVQDTSAPDKMTNLGTLNFPESLKVVVADHHISNTRFGQINLVDDSYVANCHLLYDLFKEWGLRLDHDIAVNLLVGIHTDSGGFKYPKTSASTFQAAADLIKLAPDFSKYLFTITNSNSANSVIFKGLALSSLEHYFENKLVLSVVAYPTLERQGIQEEEISGGEICSELISVIGWEVALSLIEKQPDKIFISMRTRDENKYDLSLLAKTLGGGGHKAAAGAMVEGRLETVKQTVIQTIRTTFSI